MEKKIEVMFECPWCSKEFKISTPERDAGRKYQARCPHCKNLLSQ